MPRTPGRIKRLSLAKASLVKEKSNKDLQEIEKQASIGKSPKSPKSPKTPATKKFPSATQSKTIREKIPRVAKEIAKRLIRGESVPSRNFIRRRPSKRKPIPKLVVTNAKAKKPSYLKMAIKAIDAHSGRNGTSIRVIIRYLETNYPLPENYKRFLRRALEKGVETDVLKKVSKMTFSVNQLSKAKRKTAKQKTKPSSSKKVKRKTRSKAASPTKKEKVKKIKRKTTSRKPAEEKNTKKRKITKRASMGRLGKEGESNLTWVWQFKENDNKFHNYDARASDIVEGVYQEYLTSPHTTDVRSIKSGDWEYMVDFRQMTQQNIQHESHTVRKIRRVQIPESVKNNRKIAYDE